MAGRTKLLLSTTLILLLVASGLVAYLWIDRSISKSYSDVSYELEYSSGQLAGILEQEWDGLTKADVLRRLEAFVSKSDDDSAVFFEDEEDGTVHLGFIVFEFEEERLAAVRVQP